MSLNQKVFRLTKQESPKDIKQFEEPIPKINEYEVLIKVKAVSLNFRDFAIATNKYPFPVKDNVVPLSDGSGTVVEVGEKVVGLKKGDNVIGNFDASNIFGPQKTWNYGHGGPIDGFLRQYIALPATVATKIPDESKLTFPQMAALVATGVTAYNALYGNLPLKPGQTVLHFKVSC